MAIIYETTQTYMETCQISSSRVVLEREEKNMHDPDIETGLKELFKDDLDAQHRDIDLVLSQMVRAPLGPLRPTEPSLSPAGNTTLVLFRFPVKDDASVELPAHAVMPKENSRRKGTITLTDFPSVLPRPSPDDDTPTLRDIAIPQFEEAI